MTRSELIEKLHDRNPQVTTQTLERFVTLVFDLITSTLANGDRVELRGFGSFSVRKRASRVGRNPKTGKEVSVSEKKVPFFKTGKALHQRLNP